MSGQRPYPASVVRHASRFSLEQEPVIVRHPALLSALLIPALAACGNDNDSSSTDEGRVDTDISGCASNADCALSDDGPFCLVDTRTCAAPPAGGLIGWGDGSADSVNLVEIYAPVRSVEAPDLEFHPTRDELWVVNRRYEVDGVCTMDTFTGDRCRSLAGYTTIIFNPSKENQTAEILEDENSWHFMRRPPALAFSEGDFFATCGEAFTGNFEDDPTMFIGPSLWTSDLDIYTQPSGANGSHMDMLHATPWCMGIAHEADNIYWTFNGHIGAIDRYNFNADHGPGMSDHSDGEIWRYAEGQLARVPNVPSHMEFDHDEQYLYVVDSGNNRVVRLDALTGEEELAPGPGYEPLAGFRVVEGAELEEVVPAGVMEMPSGLALHEGVLYVSDTDTSRIHAFDLEGTLLRSLDTGLPAGSLAGLAVSPDNRMYLSNMQTGVVYRIDPI